ncbi:MAG: DNA primase [bacterium]|nr:DNA primase [bacterium]
MTQIEEIKNRIDVVDLVGSYIKLQKAGSNYKACCPFHREKTPSFNVSPARQIWHCFGCSEGGDIFEFVKKIEGVEFPEALKILADRAGVELKAQDPRERGERGKELAILEEAAKFFEENLHLVTGLPSAESSATGAPTGDPVASPVAYLRSRGLTDETIKEFRLGFAPAEWKSLFNHLLSKNFSAEEQERAGLIVRSQNSKFQSQNYYDRFRSRIIFPIFDYSGRVVAFGGRVFEVPPQGGIHASGVTDAVAKYVNSPETNLYQKSKILYGLHKSKSDILKEGECVVVEGYMDWLMSWQAGVRNIVASSGTALTETQLKILRRLSEKLVAAFDMDKAGEAAAARGIELALAEGFEVRVVGELDKDGKSIKDPADAVALDPIIWQNAVKNSRHIVQFYIDSSLKKFPASSAESKREFQKSVIPVVARLSDLEKAHWVQAVGVSLGINEEAVWTAVKNYASKNKMVGAGNQEAPAVNTKSVSRKELLENRILGIAAKYPDFIQSSDNELDGSLFSGDKSVIFNHIKQKDLPAGRQDKGLAVFQELISRLTLEAELFLEGVGLARRATAEGSAYADAETEFIICKRELTKEVLKEKRGIISKELQLVEKKGGDVGAILADFQKINAELSKLN